jgi:hypothetical protein
MTYLKVAPQPEGIKKVFRSKSGSPMISPSFDIREFIEAIRRKDYLEMIHLADREAFQVWRCSNRDDQKESDQRELRAYEMRLKEFVSVIRSSVIRRKEGDPVHQLFNSVRDDVFRRGASRR